MKKWNKWLAALIATVTASCAPGPAYTQVSAAVAASMEVEGRIDPIIAYGIMAVCALTVIWVVITEFRDSQNPILSKVI